MLDEGLFDRDVEEPASLSPGGHRVIGTSSPRLDLPDKIAGRPRFVQDMVLPRMLHGRVIRPFTALRGSTRSTTPRQDRFPASSR